MSDFKKMLIPYPQKLVERSGEKLIATVSNPFFKLVYGEGGCVFDEAVSLLRKEFCDKAMTVEDSSDKNAYPINIKTDATDAKFVETGRADAYYIDIDENGAVLCGWDEGGTYYAAVTFAQLIREEYGKIYLPFVEISDYPSFVHRGQFMECRYGSDFTTLEEWCDGIDYLSKMKYNQVTVGVYGCWSVQYDNMLSEYLYIPFEKYPQLKTPRNIKYYSAAQRKWVYKKDVLPTMFEEDYLGELIAYGKKKNVTIKPLFNSLGHNTLLPRMFPEVSAKDENGNDTGFGFCTEDEETYKLMFDLYDEIIERYLAPSGIDSIEIGLDEVWPSIGINPNDIKQSFSPFCRCEKCAGQDKIDNMIEYIIRICTYLKSKGMKNIYIYHDMLFNEKNRINEDLVSKFKQADIYDVAVIDWWSYSYPGKMFGEREDEVNSLMRSIIKPMTGYYHWVIPTHRNENIQACARIAHERGFEGIESYSSFEYCYDYNYLYQAELSWNANMIEKPEDFHQRYAFINYGEECSQAEEAISSMHNIMPHYRNDNYLYSVFEYYSYSYLRANESYPRNFPGDAYKAMFEDEKLYIPYLEKSKRNAAAALAFFEKQPSHRINNIWRLNASAYCTTADEYLTLWAMQKSYGDGRTDEFKLLSELERLIGAREELMVLVEATRIRSNQYMYLRNMSIMRQYILDLRNYVKKCISKGEKPKLDLTNLDYAKSDVYHFLR